VDLCGVGYCEEDLCKVVNCMGGCDIDLLTVGNYG
jgi:hypothetical protein